jgi:coenzyme PQQ precursor peptide PqqA
VQWTKPDFQEITLGMEVTAYVNTDERQRAGREQANLPVRDASRQPAEDAAAERS